MALTPSPYVYPQPQPSPYAMSISELMEKQGEIASQRALALGNINAQAVQGVAGAVGGAIQQATDPTRQLNQQKVAANARLVKMQQSLATLRQQATNPDGTPNDEIYGELIKKGGFPPDIEAQALGELGSIQDYTRKGQAASAEGLASVGAALFHTVGALPPGDARDAAVVTAAHLASQIPGVPPDKVQQVMAQIANGADPSQVGLALMGMSPSKRYEDELKPFTTARGAVTTTPARAAAGMPPLAEGQPVPPPQPTKAGLAAAAHPGDPEAALAAMTPPKTDPLDEVVTLKTVVDGKNVELPVTRRDMLAHGPYPSQPNATTGNADMEQENAKTVAAGIIAGDTAPSILEGTRGTSQGMALLAEIKRQGGDSDKILRDWTATKTAIRSLDSPQQLRLAEVINKASASTDQLETLNQQWQDVGARFGIKAFNRASLTAAQNGFYGPQAQSIAQRLDAQIADVTSELGQGIMGGASPTDHALSLASKNLSSDWTAATLSDSIKQVRYNLNLAQNARNDLLGQMGVTSTQVQTPPPKAAAPPTAPTGWHYVAKPGGGWTAVEDK
jgi:hypothetical protein